MPRNERFAERPRAGMIVRSKETLESGLTIFKLGHRFDRHVRQTDLEVISKPWWFTAATVELICSRARAAGEQLADVFRRFGAVARRWGGSGDLIVKARLAEPLIGYIGPGTIQDFRDDPAQQENNAWDMPLWVPSPGIPQLYVPLMRRGDVSTSIAREVLSDVYVVPIDKWDDAWITGQPPARWK